MCKRGMREAGLKEDNTQQTGQHGDTRTSAIPAMPDVGKSHGRRGNSKAVFTQMYTCPRKGTTLLTTAFD